jgi:head-tail adaptor
MKAGILKEKIEIYAPTVETTEYGNSRTVYSLHYTTRASVQYNSGTRTNQNDEIFYPVTKTFIVRHYVPVTEPMRIKHDGKTYRIISIEPNKYYNDKEIITELVNE